MKKLFISKLLLFIVSFSVITALCGCGSEAEKDYKQALSYFGEGRYDEAEVEFCRAIEKKPKEPKYHIGYGMSLIRTNNYDKAREEFLSVINDSDKKSVKKVNKQAYRGIALTYFESGVYDQAKAYFELALNTKVLSDMDNDLNSYMADCEMYLGNYDNAVKRFDKLINSSKGLTKDEIAGCHLGRANANALLGNYDSAIEDYKQVIKHDKKCYAAYLGEYLAITGTNNEKVAEEILDSALKMKAKTTEDNYYFAIFRFYKGEYEASQELLNKCIEDGYKKANYYLGRIYQEKGEYKAAISAYTLYSEDNPSDKNAEYYNQLAGCYMELGEYDKALPLLNTGYSLAGGTMKKQIMYNRIIACEKAGNYESAKQYAEEYLEIYDDAAMMKEYQFIKTRYRK